VSSKDTNDPTEAQIQIAFVEYVRYKHPRVEECLIHIPNEGKRSLREGAKQKRLGLTRGVSDLFFAHPWGKYAGLWIEVKTKTGRITKEQNNFIDKMIECGYLARVVRSLDGAIDLFEQYIKGYYGHV
jgi:VRR-NUC domain-containing protein